MMTVKNGWAAQSNNIQLKIPARREEVAGAATASALILFKTFTPVAIARALNLAAQIVDKFPAGFPEWLASTEYRLLQYTHLIAAR